MMLITIVVLLSMMIMLLMTVVLLTELIVMVTPTLVMIMSLLVKKELKLFLPSDPEKVLTHFNL